MAGSTTARRGDRGLPSARPGPPGPDAVRRRISRRRALTVLITVSLLAGAVMFVLYGSPWLRVRHLRVSGTRVLTPRQVEVAAGIGYGTPLASVNAQVVAGRLRTILPRIAALDVTRSWPDTLSLKVTERTPKVLLKNGRNFIEVDADGVRYATDQTAPSGVPLVEMATDSGDGQQVSSNRYFGTDRLLHAGVQVAMDLPATVQKQTQAIVVRSWDSISLQLPGGRTVMWGSCELGPQKAVALQALLKAAAGAVRYDVSAPGAPAAAGS